MSFKSFIVHALVWFSLLFMAGAIVLTGFAVHQAQETISKNIMQKK